MRKISKYTHTASAIIHGVGIHPAQNLGLFRSGSIPEHIFTGDITMKNIVVKIVLDSGSNARVINLGGYSSKLIKEWKKQGTASTLYKSVCRLVDDFYQNDVLCAIEAHGNSFCQEACSYASTRPSPTYNASGTAKVFS